MKGHLAYFLHLIRRILNKGWNQTDNTEYKLLHFEIMEAFLIMIIQQNVFSLSGLYNQLTNQMMLRFKIDLNEIKAF
jgi:hypothetical protein